LLLAGRLETQQPRLDQAVDLVEIARETVERLALLPAARAHDLRLDVPHRPVVINGDAESLGDALRNLVDNAIAHGPAGSPVEIAVRSDGVLEVRDRGPGIPREDREQIFEPFWRARKSSGEGAGLGLAIVRNVVARHGGRISVTDNPGGGALFRMKFPLA
jgi:signal transduction histidine kinase